MIGDFIMDFIVDLPTTVPAICPFPKTFCTIIGKFRLVPAISFFCVCEKPEASKVHRHKLP
jgi:hypothetical protein